MLKRQERWEVLHGPKCFNFLPSYNKLLSMGANDHMVYQSLVKVLERDFFCELGLRSEWLFRKYWLNKNNLTFKELTKQIKLSVAHCRQINKKTEMRLFAKTGYPRIIRIRVKQALYQEILEKILQQQNP